MRTSLRDVTLFAIALVSVSSGCANRAGPRYSTANPPVLPNMVGKPAKAGDDGTLVVALFPYVPRYDQMKQTLSAMWNQLGTGVQLEFVDSWDCYSQNPPANAEVIVYDAVQTQYLQSINAIQPVPVDDVDATSDFFPVAWNAVQLGNGNVVGIPQLLCTNAMYYRSGDAPLQNAAGYIEMMQAIGPFPGASYPLPAGQGLYFDLSGGTTDALLYLQMEQIANGQYTTTPLLPSLQQLDSFTLEWLSLISYVGGQQQVLFKPTTSYDPRLQQLAGGSGRAAVTYTETLASVPVAQQAGLAVRQFPFGEQGWTLSFYYCDVASLTTNVSASEYSDAVALANLMTSSGYLAAMSLPTATDPSPQYLLLPRPSVYGAMTALGFPRYQDYYTMVTTAPSPVVLMAGAGVRNWYGDPGIKNAIRNAITTPPTSGIPQGLPLRRRAPATAR